MGERRKYSHEMLWEKVTLRRIGMKNLQFISNTTVVDTGIVILLLAAWHVNRALRSLRCNLPIVNVLETTVEVTCSEETSQESSRSAFSRHQLTLGTGHPVKKKMYLLR